MSVHMWGESPLGLWTLEVYNEGKYMGKYFFKLLSHVIVFETRFRTYKVLINHYL